MSFENLQFCESVSFNGESFFTNTNLLFEKIKGGVEFGVCDVHVRNGIVLPWSEAVHESG